MAAGGPGDHPISDICDHGMSVYSAAVDELVRRISRLMPRYRLAEMVDWFRPPPDAELERLLSQRLDELEAEARRSGWELLGPSDD